MALCPHHWKIGGVSLNSKLWTAKILAEQPELIKQVHKNYFKAGADCGITCSYQASIPGLMENGYTLEEAEGQRDHRGRPEGCRKGPAEADRRHVQRGRRPSREEREGAHGGLIWGSFPKRTRQGRLI